MPIQKKPYQKTAGEILKEFSVRIEEGLLNQEAEERLHKFGPNTLAVKKKKNLVNIFLKQFQNPFIYILFVAAAMVLLVGQKTDALVILVIVVINGFIGTVQEGKAQNSLEKLRDLTKHKTLVRRNGEETLKFAEEIVVGDILVLHEGSVVPADARLVNEAELLINEAILTGEAFSVEKTVGKIDQENIVVGDQKNMVFAGTSVSSGYGEAIVVATGFASELGKISEELLATADAPLPLEKKVTKLTHYISLAVLLIATAIFLIGLVKGISLIEIFGAVVGLSVSIIPEGLPVVVTIVLAKGVWRMAKAKAIVRKMAAVEAMGGADTLLVDKTGTITTGRMVVRELYFNGEKIEVSGDGYEPDGKVTGESVDKLRETLELAYLALKADIVKEGASWVPVGDPTEAAIAVLCRKLGLSKEDLAKYYPTIYAKPFDSKKRYSEALFKKDDKEWKVVVGAPDFLGDEFNLKTIQEENSRLAQEGKRVVGIVLFEPGGKVFSSTLLLMEEEVRESVKQSISEAKKAGFRVVMMTGDYPKTAQAIAAKVGIFEVGDKVLTGEDVETLKEAGLLEEIEKVSVFARITPEHKLRIVNAFKAKGHVVAMTGDGVNDSPALQAANLGIGLGSGTQVAKDAADIVLVDDNFSTIIAAIAEGRAIYLTLKKVILYLFSTSFGEVLVISVSIIVGLPLPLLAAQIIWLNFVTDGFLDVSLAQDPPEDNTLAKIQDEKNLVDRLMLNRIFLMGASMLVVTLPAFYYFNANSSLTYARSFTLLLLSVIQWLNVLNVRSEEKSVFNIPLNNNYFLLVSFLVVFALELFALQTNLGNKLLHTEPLALADWFLAFGLSTVIVVVEEIRKLFKRSQVSYRPSL